MKKRVGIFSLVLCIYLGILYPGITVYAANGTTSVSVSAGTVNIGDTVTVTVSAAGPAGEKTIATMTVSYDTSVLQFVSCSSSVYGGGGSTVTATGDSFSVTLKAVAAGSSAISVSAADGVLFDTTEELDAMSGSSASVTVNNAASTGGSTSTGGTSTGGTSTGGTAAGGSTGGTTGSTTTTAGSADNSLKSLVLSSGTLSPAFASKTTKYSMTVANDVTSIAVTATPANNKATVESVTGNDNLAVGNNTIKIVVKAENGVTATYTINVNRQAAGATNSEAPDSEAEEDSETEQPQEAITIDGVIYEVAENFTTEEIPTDFIETTVNYHDNEYKGLSFEKGLLSLLYLKEASTEEASGSFFVYDQTRDICYPFVKMGNDEKYVVALLAPVDFVAPENYQQATVTVNENKTMTVYQETSEENTEVVSDFSMFYGVNHEGSEGWYRYDALEETYQRCEMVAEEEEASDGTDMEYLQEQYVTLSDKYKKEKSFARNMFAVLVFLLAVMMIIIINLLLHRKKDHDDFSDDDDSDDDDSDDGNSNDNYSDRDGSNAVLDDADVLDADVLDDIISTVKDSEDTVSMNSFLNEDVNKTIEVKESKEKITPLEEDDDLEIIDLSDL